MKHWVFDLDGTLVDSFPHYFRALEYVFSEHGAKFTCDLQSDALTLKLEDLFATHLGEKSVASAFEKLQTRSNEDAASIPAFQGIPAALELIHEQGARIAIWTNRDFTSAELILKHSGLAKYVDAFVSGTCVTRRKPDTEGLLRVTEILGCKPVEVTMVGDHEHDVTAGKAVGARSVRASWHGPMPLTRCEIADHQFGTVAEFTRWIHGLRK